MPDGPGGKVEQESWAENEDRFGQSPSKDFINTPIYKPTPIRMS